MYMEWIFFSQVIFLLFSLSAAVALIQLQIILFKNLNSSFLPSLSCCNSAVIMLLVSLDKLILILKSIAEKRMIHKNFVFIKSILTCCLI